MNFENKSIFSMYDFLDDLISVIDSNGRIIECNTSFYSFFKQDKESILSLEEKELFNYKQVEDNKKNCIEKVYLNESIHFFSLQQKNITLDNQEYIINIRKNVTKEENLATLYEENKNILKQIAQDENLNNILDSIIESAEKMNFDMKCSILLLDEDKKRLHTASSPNIPDFFTSKIDGMEIGEEVGSCGAAAFLKQRVIIEDIQNHKNWKRAKNLAKEANFYACWSHPIFSSKGEVLGTFAMYYPSSKKPTEFDLYVIEDRANLAGIAIEKHNNELKIEQNRQKEIRQQELLMHKTKQAMMGEMIENIAHQWRQPLSVISTSATGINLKKELGILSEDLEKSALIAINENAQYLSKTIDDFRNYFKSENVEHKFNLTSTIKRTLKLIDVLIKNKFVEVNCQIEEDIYLHNLENELIQVFMNIFNNSIDQFENKNIDEKYISIVVYKKDNNAIIKINDSGLGTTNTIVNRIFEPYFTTKHKSNGTGIGLYMCKEMIESHMKGSIEASNNTFEINNKEYLGLEFTITLPIETRIKQT